MIDVLGKFSPQAHWLLRAGLAAVFLFHGIGKVADISGFSEMMALPVVVVVLVTFAEIAGGIGILIGGFGNEKFTRLAALAMIPVLLGAIVLVHGPRWSFAPTEGFPLGGMEFQVVLLLMSSFFLVTGNASSNLPDE